MLYLKTATKPPVPFTAAIFDMDGLLFDTEDIYIEAWGDVAARHGIANGGQLGRRTIGINDVESVAVISEYVGDAVFGKALYLEVQGKREEILEAGGPRKKPGLMPLLDYLRAAGILLGVASSTREARVRRNLELEHITQYFSAVAAGDMPVQSKPAPDLFLLAAKQLGVNPTSCIAFEDSPMGARAARAAGMPVLVVPDMVQPDDDVRAFAHAVLGSLHEVLPLLHMHA